MRADHRIFRVHRDARRRGLSAAFAVLVAITLVLAGCASSSTGAGAGSRAPLVLGAVVALTGSASSEGPQQANGINLAESQINAGGGIDGAPLQVLIRDDGSSVAAAASLMRELATRDKALAVIGPTTSDAAVVADPVADRLQVPVIAVSNVVNGVVGHCGYPCSWIWRDSLGEAVTVPDAISFAVQTMHPRTAAIVYSTPDLLGGEDAADAASAFRAQSVPVVAEVSAPQSSTSLTGLLRGALAGKPDTLFIGSSSAQFVALVVHAARGLGYKGAFIGGNSLNSTTAAGLLGQAGAGALSGAAWTRHVDFPANAAFLQAYQDAYGELPDQFAAQAFTAVQILAAALRAAKAGWTADTSLTTRRAGIQSALPDTALMTPLGPFRFTASHDVDQDVWIVAVDGQGQHTLEDFCNPAC
jgi:branched-chain amino acid transport system substrate-binding protein